jgi:ATP-dependent helicase/DNAse subunit B
MIGGFFGTLDSVAHVLGWLTIIVGIIWLATRGLEGRRVTKEWLEDRDAQMRFERYLEETKPDQFRAYMDIRDRNAMNQEDVHWHKEALEAGVPMAEIIAKR